MEIAPKLRNKRTDKMVMYFLPGQSNEGSKLSPRNFSKIQWGSVGLYRNSENYLLEPVLRNNKRN